MSIALSNGSHWLLETTRLTRLTRLTPCRCFSAFNGHIDNALESFSSAWKNTTGNISTGGIFNRIEIHSVGPIEMTIKKWVESCHSLVKLTINHCMSRLAILPKSSDVTLVIFCAALARVGLFWGGFSVAQRCVCHPSGDYGMLVPSVKFSRL